MEPPDSAPKWSDVDSLVPGTLLGRRYRLLDRIGVGGMSVIWRAQDELLDRSVAVKVLAADLAADSRFRALVRAEARAAAALAHPHLTATYDYGETFNADGGFVAYVVMELLTGEPLSARLTAGPLPWPEALRTCAEVADALAAAHRHGIVHRDVTADNVMLTGTGARVLDFGIATTVGAPDEDTDGLTFGTPAYVAPERLDGHRARPATDTYALGVLLFETLVGHPPYPVETWEELAASRTGEPPRPVVAGLPEPVVVLCQRCLATDPWQRPTASQVAAALRSHLPGAGRSRSAGRPGRSRRRAVVAAGAAAALALGVAAGAAVLNPGPPTPVAQPDRSPGDPAPDPPPVLDPRPDQPPGYPAPDQRPGYPAPDQRPGYSEPERPAGTPAPGMVTLGTVSRLVADGQARDDIRPDVALDLRQLIENLRRDLAAGSTDLPSVTALLRDKVWVRAAEGGLGPASAAALDAALDQLST
jgi:serine/threonine-protein kinase